jgi:hypothetical protein
MSHVEVVTAELRTASGQLKRAAEVVDGISLDSAVSLVAAALPGSASADLAASLASVWQSAIEFWAKDTRTHSEALVRCSVEYDCADETAAQWFR